MNEEKTITVQPENNLIIEVNRTLKDWCAYEHWATLTPGEPPQCIMVGVCRLVDVYKLADGRNNSQWSKIFANGGSLMIRILATGDNRPMILNHAVRASRLHNPPPLCNTQGYNMAGAMRRIACSNGEVYDNQAHAASSLGTYQSAISRHLLGHSSHVKGHTLSYIGAE